MSSRLTSKASVVIGAGSRIGAQQYAGLPKKACASVQRINEAAQMRLRMELAGAGRGVFAAGNGGNTSNCVAASFTSAPEMEADGYVPKQLAEAMLALRRLDRAEDLAGVAAMLQSDGGSTDTFYTSTEAH